MIPATADAIIVRVVYNGEEFTLRTFRNEYRNLMMLMYDKLGMDDFGECKGMGRCGTCLVEVMESHQPLSPPERNEAETIRKTGMANADRRLACQFQVDHTIHHIKLKVVSYDL